MGLFKKSPPPPPPPPSRTSPEDVARVLALVEACLITDADEFDVRASVLLRPDATVEDAEDSYFLANLGFTEADRIALYMDVSADCLVKASGRIDDREETLREAVKWVGPTSTVTAFRDLPGVFQAQFLSHVTAREVHAGPAELMWAIPHSSGMFMYREFPPRTGPTELTPTPGEVSIGLMRPEGIDAMWSEADWVR